MNSHVLVIIIYALIVLGGGVMGFVKAQSLASLATGIISGVVLLTSAITLWGGQRAGYYVATGTTLCLMLFFSYRLYLSQKFMPSGLMALISLAVLCFLFFSQRGR